MTLEEIKQQYRMIDILNKYSIKVNRAGFACCPFHNEKTPSMKVYEQNFHCFGCGAHGDIINFEEKYNGIDFQSALKLLGGSSENLNFKQKLSIYKSKKDAERKKNQEKRRKEFEKKQKRLERKYKVILSCSLPLSEEWAMAYNKLMIIYNDYANKNSWTDWGGNDFDRWLNWID